MDEPEQIEVARKAASQGAKVKGVGLVRGNPRLCFRCLQSIGELDPWTKYTSAADPPEYAVYSIIFHARCDGLGAAANQLAASA
jgi:hypothetical protein